MKTCLVLALAGAVSLSSAFATTLTEMSLEQLTAQAEVAVVGKVVSANTIKTDNGIATVTQVSVINDLWGAAGARTLEVLTLGGATQSGRYRVGETYAGAQLLSKGEVSMFLLKLDNQSGKYVVVGFNQGRLPVLQSAEGKQVMVPGKGVMQLESGMAALKSAKAAPSASSIRE